MSKKKIQEALARAHKEQQAKKQTQDGAPVAPEPTTPSEAKVEAKVETKTEVKVARRTIRGVCREMIMKGYSNSEIWAVIKPEFNMPDSHKHYPAWYRNEMRRLAKTKEERDAVPVSRPQPRVQPQATVEATPAPTPTAVTA